jgi:uridine kinase
MQSGLSRFVIGMTGQSGSGKTYFIHRIKEILGDQVAVISFDDYYKPLEEQVKDDQGVTNFDLPGALYHQRFCDDLLKLIEGHPVLIKKYNFENYGAPERVDIIETAPVIIAEGLFVFDFSEIDALLSYRIFIEADMQLSLQRRLARDTRERGIPEERSLYQWHNHVMPAWEKHIFPHQSRCNLVLKNEGSAEDNIQRIAHAIRSNAHPEVLKEIADRLN